jgi:hypothetical protein
MALFEAACQKFNGSGNRVARMHQTSILIGFEDALIGDYDKARAETGVIAGHQR